MMLLVQKFRRWIMAATCFSLLLMGSNAYAKPHNISSPELRPVTVNADRAPGRLIIYANYATHRILLDDAEVPDYLSDIGVEVSSNELHKIRVIAEDRERTYKISVNPGQTMALYVDLGAKKTVKKDNKNTKNQDKTAKGLVTVTAVTESQIYIDGKLVSSKTPLTRYEVATGTHTVRVYFLDTKKFSKSRDVYVGKAAQISVHFNRD